MAAMATKYFTTQYPILRKVPRVGVLAAHRSIGIPLGIFLWLQHRTGFDTAGWLAKVKFKVRTLRELITKGVISAHSLSAAEEARDFLWRVRNGLHLLARSEQDQLTFEYQDQLAPALGFADVTSFMRHY